MKACLYSLCFVLCALANAIPVTIELHAPDAAKVLVAGEFNDWKPIELSKAEDGSWRTELDLAGGDYGYKFIVDEVWLFDPTSAERKEVDGNVNSKLVVIDPDAPIPPEIRDWKDSITGNTIHAELVAVDGNFAVLKVEDNTFRVRKERLRPVDQAYIANWEPPFVEPTTDDSQKVTAPKQVTASTDPQDSPFKRSLAPHQTHVTPLPMRHRLRYVLTSGEFNPSRDSETMKVAIAYPDNFDPTSADNKIVIINQTVDGDASNVGAMNQYAPSATRNGWVCIAIDIEGDEDQRKHWSGMSLRYLLIYSALMDMHEIWPQSKEWKYATFGFSGGAGYANYIGARLTKERYNLVGVWNGGSGYTDSHFNKQFEPTRAFYRSKYFLSRGTRDTVATEQIAERARSWADNKFNKFRFKTYDGEHHTHTPHVEEALQWFAED
jgi:hypothetical protein